MATEIKENSAPGIIFDGLTADSSGEVVQMIPGGANGDGAGIECGTTVLSESEDGRTVTGVWRCEPCDWAPMETGERAEFFQVLEGSIVLCEEGGEPVEAGVGTSVYSPPGWVGTWRVPTRLRKSFVTFYPSV
jgi:uncharacterized cupin superfamily protein